MSWHNEVFSEMGWFEELRQRKIERGDICGGCGEWPEFCCCEKSCLASISGLCLAITQNNQYCEPECEIRDTMDGTEQKESGV